jgi:hypothetical protein
VSVENFTRQINIFEDTSGKFIMSFLRKGNINLPTDSISKASKIGAWLTWKEPKHSKDGVDTPAARCEAEATTLIASIAKSFMTRPACIMVRNKEDTPMPALTPDMAATFKKFVMVSHKSSCLARYWYDIQEIVDNVARESYPGGVQTDHRKHPIEDETRRNIRARLNVPDLLVSTQAQQHVFYTAKSTEREALVGSKSTRLAGKYQELIAEQEDIMARPATTMVLRNVKRLHFEAASPVRVGSKGKEKEKANPSGTWPVQFGFRMSI